MRILVVGAGAIGCLFSARLKTAGHEVGLLEVLHERVEAINRQGIRVEGLSGEYRADVPAYAEPFPFDPDLVLICVKAYDTRKAAQAVRAFQGSAATVLTLQNGLGNVDILGEVLGNRRVLGGVTAEGATLLGPGLIRHAGQGETVIQADAGSDEIVSAFQTAGFKAKAQPNIQDYIWGKLIVNVGVNALAAITRLKNGRLPELDGSRLVMEQSVSEALAVADALGVTIPYPDPHARVKQVCLNTEGNVASMLQDVLRSQPTEIAFINGAVVREGKRLGIPTPVNFTLTSLVEAIQETYQERVA